MATVTTVLSTAAVAFLAKVHRAGAYQNATWTSVVKPAAAHKDVLLEKVTTAKIRTGVDYSHLGVNADRTTGALKWGAWAVFPYIIVHEGREYARLYVEDGTVRVLSRTVNGEKVDRETFDAYLTEGARKSRRSVGGTITVHLANVTLH